jgi:hypothetical protein
MDVRCFREPDDHDLDSQVQIGTKYNIGNLDRSRMPADFCSFMVVSVCLVASIEAVSYVSTA